MKKNDSTRIRASMKRFSTEAPRYRVSGCMALVTMVAHISQAYAAAPASGQLPTGGQVVAGTAQISTSGATLNVNQSSQRAVVDWRSFDVGSNATVNFRQPSASGVTLNRVLGADPSQVYGRVTANGQVFLVNPAGIYFSPSASVDVGGLVATTHSIGLTDFMAGNAAFSGNGTTGAVTNDGRITATLGGYIALLAPEVRNNGVIVAQRGTVALAAGEAFTLQFSGNGLAGLSVTPGQFQALVENRQAVEAPGGLIILSAQALNALQGSVVNSGSIEASSLQDRGGRIMLEGGAIELASGSTISANGATGGGSVNVGSASTERVIMARDASISADALSQGDGGQIVMLSNLSDAQATSSVQGSLSARGAGVGAQGGLVETSGANVNFNGVRVDTRSLQGQSGTWLVDPYDLTVDSAAASTIGTNLGTTNVTLQTTASGSSGPGVVNPAGNGDIIVNSAINWSSANTLTLDAFRNVNVNANLIGGGAIALKAGAGVVVSGATLQTNGKDITLWSNDTGASVGGIYVKNNSVLDSRTNADRTASNTSNASGGGTITLGGGTASTTLASGTVVPTGAALNAPGTMGGLQLGTTTGSLVGQNSNISIYSGGGNISMIGSATSQQANFDGKGIGVYEGVTIDGGSAGSVYINGSSTVVARYGTGVELGTFPIGSAPVTVRTKDGGITIIGFSNGGTNTNNGVTITGYVTTPLTIAATGLGSVNINGNAGGAGALDLGIGAADILAASGSINLTGSGSGSTLTAGAGFVGGNRIVTLGSKAGSVVTSSTSNVTLTDNTFVLAAGNGINVNTSGTLTVQSYDDNFVGAFSMSPIVPAATVSSLTIGKSLGAVAHTDTVNVNEDISIAGPISVNAGIINLSNALISTGSNNVITLTAGTKATQSAGSLSASQLSLQGDGYFVLNRLTNSIGTLAAGSASRPISSLVFDNSGALTIGTVGSASGINSSGAVGVATTSGDLTVAQNITSAAASGSSVILISGMTAAAGTAAGGNIVIADNPTVTTASGARAVFYSGSATTDRSLANWIGNGSGRFRYNSDESATNYTTALGTGLYGIYRQAIATNVVVASQGMTYGSAAAPLASANNLVNGDTASLALVSPQYSGAGYLNAGSYVIAPTSASLNALAGLGYTVSDNTNGTLSVARRTLTVTANDAARDAGQPAFSGGNGVTYVGFAAGENAGVLSGQLSYGGNSQGASQPGVYVITPGGYSAANYDIQFVGGKLLLVSVPPLENNRGGNGNLNRLVGSEGGVWFSETWTGNGVKESAVKGVGADIGSDITNIASVVIDTVVKPTEYITGVTSVWVPHDFEVSGIGFVFPLPDELAAKIQKNEDVDVSLLSGDSLPNWLRYDQNRKVFVASAVPDGALPVQVMVKIKEIRNMIVITQRPRIAASL